MTIDLRYGDTIEQMKLIPDKSIDFICCDLPYGTTACAWDIIIPFDKLWEQYERIIKDGGNIALFGVGLFGSKLVCSNEKLFKYENDYPDVFLNFPSGTTIINMKNHEIPLAVIRDMNIDKILNN